MLCEINFKKSLPLAAWQVQVQQVQGYLEAPKGHSIRRYLLIHLTILVYFHLPCQRKSIKAFVFYRVTIRNVPNLPLTSKQKCHFSIRPMY